jgi:hypothetical protein
VEALRLVLLALVPLVVFVLLPVTLLVDRA